MKSMLLALPTELRTKIYRLKLVSGQASSIKPVRLPPSTPGLPQVCRQLREEVLGIYLKRTHSLFKFGTSVLTPSSSGATSPHIIKAATVSAGSSTRRTGETCCGGRRRIGIDSLALLSSYHPCAMVPALLSICSELWKVWKGE